MAYRIVKSQRPITVNHGWRKPLGSCPALDVIEPEPFDSEGDAYKRIVERFHSGEYRCGPSGLADSEGAYHMDGAGDFTYTVEEDPRGSEALCVEIIHKFVDYYNDEYTTNGHEQFIFGPFADEDQRAQFISQFAKGHHLDELAEEDALNGKKVGADKYWPCEERMGYDRVTGIRPVQAVIRQESPGLVEIIERA